MAKDVIIALDMDSADKVFAFLRPFRDSRPFVKIGMELFYAEGPDMVRRLKDMGFRIFLDLKLHDIPNTVRKAMKVLAGLKVDMTNVHAGGTIAMMEAARDGLTRSDGKTLLLAVTQLTSTSEERMHDELLIQAGMQETVLHYAMNAKTAGLDGVVCSPLEARAVKEHCGFLTVTPGIRFADGNVGDQVRVMTPARAREAGSDYIVVGRPITAAEDPVTAYRRCVKEFLG